jgi:dihydrofolate reductase
MHAASWHNEDSIRVHSLLGSRELNMPRCATTSDENPIRVHSRSFVAIFGRVTAMGKVILDLTMSLDGFIAGANDGPQLPLGEGGERLFDWYFKGDTEFEVPNGTMTFKTDPASVRVIEEMFDAGAAVTGRRTFDITNGWNGRHTADVPVFVVTHNVPHEWIKAHEGAPFTFVIDGVESAIDQAKAAAGDKYVGVGAATVAQQAMKAGLLDEIQIHLVPLLLGRGVRLFDNLGEVPVELEITRVVEGSGVTHLRYSVAKNEGI